MAEKMMSCYFTIISDFSLNLLLSTSMFIESQRDFAYSEATSAFDFPRVY